MTPPVQQVELVFSDWRPLRHLSDALHKDLSAVALVGDCIFVACDETASVERLQRTGENRYGSHRHFPLGEILDLPGGPHGEMDIEGLAAGDGYLWILGSHSLKRTKPERQEHGGADGLKRMEEVVREPNRFFLGRVPLEEEEPGVFRPRSDAGGRRAAALKMGSRKSRLTKWLLKDPLLSGFVSIPSKENGLDLEGVAVAGERVWVGMRGPVLRGHAVVLDLELAEGKSRLKARRRDGGKRYRTHLLDTDGLGIRDLCRDGDDLLLLVGPTMSLEGPAYVLRWRDAAVERASGIVDPRRIEQICALPYQLDTDHPEGLEIWPHTQPAGLFVLYDAPGPDRVGQDEFSVKADIFHPARESSE